MKIIIGILLSAIFFSASCASSFADSITRKAVLSRFATSGAGSFLPKTGQLPSQTTNSGDDGELQKGYPGTRFTVDAVNNTVTDNATGLVWIKNPASLGTRQGKDGVSVNWTSLMTWTDAVKNCYNLSYKGHVDWRLPNVRELESIMDYDTTNILTAAVDPIFVVTSGQNYWSSTTFAQDTSSAWQWYGSNGCGMTVPCAKVYNPPTTARVLPVRNG